MKAEAKKAALMARAASLEKKHALELEEAKIRVMKEKLKVKTSGGQSTQIKYLSKSTDTYNKILLQ